MKAQATKNSVSIEEKEEKKGFLLHLKLLWLWLDFSVKNWSSVFGWDRNRKMQSHREPSSSETIIKCPQPWGSRIARDGGVGDTQGADQTFSHLSLWSQHTGTWEPDSGIPGDEVCSPISWVWPYSFGPRRMLGGAIHGKWASFLPSLITFLLVFPFRTLISAVNACDN